MIISLCNQKGGVGKTTTTLNLAAALQRTGARVMVIDLDPQAHLTYSLGLIDLEDRDELTVYEVLKKPSRLIEAIQMREGLELLPSSLALSGAEIELSSEPGREYLLSRALKPIKNKYDYILIDCPPALGLLTLNALTACDDLYVPLETSALSLQGIKQLMQTVEIIHDRLNPKLAEIGGVILTRFDSRRKLDNKIVEMITKMFAGRVFKTVIRQNVSLAEAPSHGKSIFEYEPNSTGAEDYAALAGEVLKRRKK